MSAFDTDDRIERAKSAKSAEVNFVSAISAIKAAINSFIAVRDLMTDQEDIDVANQKLAVAKAAVEALNVWMNSKN